MIITDSDIRQFMWLIECRILELREKYNSLQKTKEMWDDVFTPTNKTSGLTITEIEQIQNSLSNEQYELFKKWYALNSEFIKMNKSHYTQSKTRELAQSVINFSNFQDFIVELNK